MRRKLIRFDPHLVERERQLNDRCAEVSPASASGRKAPFRAASRPEGSDFRLLSDLERVVDLNAEVPHRALELRVAE